MYTKHFNLSKNFSKALSPAVMLGDENLKFPSLEAKKNNFLITSLQTKGLA